MGKLCIADAGEVQLGSQVQIVVTERTIAPKSIDIAIAGRKLWERLHTEPTLEVLAAIEKELPRFGCSCDKFYSDWKEKHPFPANGTEWEKFVWTVDLHNAVNVKLKKPEMSSVDAWKQWRVNRCDQCGLCCKELSVEFSEADRCSHPALPILKPAGEGCPMQLESGACSCHESKPLVCKRFVAGGWLCNLLRENAGLERI